MLRTTTARETDMSKPGLPIKRVEIKKDRPKAVLFYVAED